MKFEIEAAIRLKLALVERSELRIHEEIIPELLEELARRIKGDGVVKHPVITDAKTLVVLDGTHRVAAFEKLGVRYVPNCLVDYRDSKIGLGCWYRTVHGITIEAILGLLEPLGLKGGEASVGEAKRALDARKAPAAVLSKNACYLLRADVGGVREAYLWVGRIEKTLADRGLGICYETERDAEEKVLSGEVDAALMAPSVRKEDVLEVALSGNVFVPKTTRHVIPARPVGIDVPLEWLVNKKSREEIERAFVGHLSKRKVKRLPRGTLFEGRRYEEELWLFE